MIKITPYGPVTRIDSARTLAGRGRYWTTAYLVDGLLIDSGCAHTANELVAQLSDEKIACLINTHSHEDHIGANGLLQQGRENFYIFAHPAALPILSDPRRAQPLQLYRRVMWGWPEPCSAVPIADGGRFKTDHYNFEILYTPGHSPDHLCLYEPEQGWLFSGDLFVGGRDRALRRDNDIWQIIASLKKAAALPLTRLFPGCAQVRENPTQALREKISYLEEIGGKVRELHEKGWPSKKIARKLFGRPRAIELVTGGQFSRRALVDSFLQEKP